MPSYMMGDLQIISFTCRYCGPPNHNQTSSQLLLHFCVLSRCHLLARGGCHPQDVVAPGSDSQQARSDADIRH